MSHVAPRPTSRLRTTERSRREHGYILVMFALMLIPLLLMVGFAVDVGSWYNRTSDIQKAADAASLAGVVWLPDEAKAEAAALAAAKKNGFDPSDPDITVDVSPSTKALNRLKVVIEDRRVGSFIYQHLGGSEIEIGRTSFAEYVEPVRMGSPLNNLGNDPTKAGYPVGAPNLWASISGPQAELVNGDPYSTKKSTEYRKWGYLYVVDVPAGAVNQSITLAVYDAGQYARSNYPNVETADNGTVNTQFELFGPDDTPLNPMDNIDPSKNRTMAGRCNSGTPGRFRLKDDEAPSTYKNKWVNLCTFTPTEAGKWILQVKSSDIPGIADAGAGWNQFSLRAVATGLVQPALYTHGDISLFNNLPGRSGTINANFYLAEIQSFHAGKTLQISLFDPGDGNSGTYYANIRGPLGTVNPCKYRARGTTSWTNSATCRITTRINGTNTYNGKWLDIQIPLDTTYTCVADCWWSVLYEFQNVSSGASPNDRTVWAARVIGDPVHLIEE